MLRIELSLHTPKACVRSSTLHPSVAVLGDKELPVPQAVIKLPPRSYVLQLLFNIVLT